MGHKNIKDRTGEKFTTNEGYEVIITEYFGALNSTIVFKDKFKTVLHNVKYQQLLKCNIENPNHQKTYNIDIWVIGKMEILYLLFLSRQI